MKDRPVLVGLLFVLVGVVGALFACLALRSPETHTSPPPPWVTAEKVATVGFGSGDGLYRHPVPGGHLYVLYGYRGQGMAFVPDPPVKKE